VSVARRMVESRRTALVTASSVPANALTRCLWHCEAPLIRAHEGVLLASWWRRTAAPAARPMTGTYVEVARCGTSARRAIPVINARVARSMAVVERPAPLPQAARRAIASWAAVRINAAIARRETHVRVAARTRRTALAWRTPLAVRIAEAFVVGAFRERKGTAEDAAAVRPVHAVGVLNARATTSVLCRACAGTCGRRSGALLRARRASGAMIQGHSGRTPVPRAPVRDRASPRRAVRVARTVPRRIARGRVHGATVGAALAAPRPVPVRRVRDSAFGATCAPSLTPAAQCQHEDGRQCVLHGAFLTAPRHGPKYASAPVGRHSKLGCSGIPTCSSPPPPRRTAHAPAPSPSSSPGPGACRDDRDDRADAGCVVVSDLLVIGC
jgi:hypothetical protein